MTVAAVAMPVRNTNDAAPEPSVQRPLASATPSSRITAAAITRPRGSCTATV